MKALIKTIEVISEVLGKWVSRLSLFMVIVMFLVVVLRYAFSLGWEGMQQSVTYMYAVFFLLGISYTQKHHGHVRVDIFYQNFPPKGKALVDLVGTLLLMLPMCGFIFWNSLDFVLLSWQTMESSNTAGGLPGVFILKSFLLVMPVLLFLQGIAQILKILLWLRGELPHLAPYDVAEKQEAAA